MILFDASKLTVEHVYMKSITTALGGAMVVVADDESTSPTRIKLPFALARQFIKKHEISTYLKPVLISVARYEGDIVALERHPLGSIGTETAKGFDGKMAVWTSEIEKSITTQLDHFIGNRTWYTDGVFMYNFIDEEPTDLTADGKFKSVPVEAISFASLEISGPLVDTARTCVRYTTADGQEATSPPIWKTLSTIGDKLMSSDEDLIPSLNSFQFDKVNEALSVNLSFALKAANELSQMYGYDAIEPLALDDLMIQLNTVNLPTQPKHIKRTFDIGMPFTHAMAWLIGLGDRTKTLQSYRTSRSLLKFLTTQGVFFSQSLATPTLFQDGMSYDNVPLMTPNELTEQISDKSIKDIIEINSIRNRRSDKPSDVAAIGSLFGAV